MQITRKALCLIYGVIALLALIGTWGNNLQYFNLGIVGANIRFWQETFANPASRSMTVDIFFLTLAVSVWLLLEARRLTMRGAWLYIIFGAFIAISVTVPIFLINRERALAARDTTSTAGNLDWVDGIGLFLLGATSIAYTAASFLR